MAAPRPYWKGHLKLSLVSCPIALYSAATSSERVSFRQINKRTGHRLRQQLIDEVTREPVESADKGRGYEIGKNVYLPVEDDELDAVAIESSHTIEIDRFVPRAQIDERYFDSPYYLAPTDEVGQEAFAVIREAMRSEGMVALARIVLAKRERVIMLQPWDKGLLGTTLRYGYEVRGADEYFEGIQDVKVAPDMLKLAKHILETKAGDFEPEEFSDRYEDAVVDLLKRKQAGMPAPRAKPMPGTTNVISLMDALKKSLGGAPAAAPKRAAGGKRAAAKEEAMRKQPQFKLPIAGGKKAARKDAGKPVDKPAAVAPSASTAKARRRSA
ncbi:MAG: Ku protein [Variibacter sp.]